MVIKLFGKELFSKEDRVNKMFEIADINRSESKYLPDFYRNFNNGMINVDYEPEILVGLANSSTVTASDSSTLASQPSKDVANVKVEEAKDLITPKKVYELKTLHDDKYVLNTETEYVDKQLADFRKRLELISMSENDMRNGVMEIESMVARLENRKKYPVFNEFYEQYAYTTTAKIKAVTKEHNHLKLGTVEQFIASLPQEATDEMAAYKDKTFELCGKYPLFYIIADKKDFRQTDQRKDPILLVQSPFAHMWQILGAWDEEMILLEDL